MSFRPCVLISSADVRSRWSSVVCPLAFQIVGILFLMIIVAVGAAYGTAKAGIGIAGLGGFKPDLVMKVSTTSISTAFGRLRLILEYFMLRSR